MREWLRERYQQWLRRRIPPSREVVLDQRRIFIFPTAYGFFYIIICFLLFLGGTNYENNLIIGLSFLMASLFVNSIMHTFRNLSGLKLAAGDMRPGFAGASGALAVKLFAGRHAHRSLWLRWPDGQVRECSLERDDEKVLWLDLPLPRRGKVRPGRLRIQTRYPLGLLRAWSLIDLDTWCLAWPRPTPLTPAPAGGGDEDDSDQRRGRGNEDFEGLRNYVPGDSLRLVDWKSFARGRGLNTKEFSDPVEGRLWLEWDRVPAVGVEQRLEYLSYWVQELDRGGAPFGLRLPQAELSPDAGPEQRRRALDLLAMFGE